LREEEKKNSQEIKEKRKIENKDEHTIFNWSLSKDVSPTFSLPLSLSLLMICHLLYVKQ
jgi:hypothetical protein